jgi:4-hydroxy-3-methylbut-2-enyl diphosphate reductase
VGVVCQSTLLGENFNLWVEALKSRCAEVVAVNTICRPTKNRQDSVKALAKKAQVIVVIGGFNSSNTKKLKDMAVQILGEKDTHHIETADQLDKGWFEGKQAIGVTAGASTPDYLIDQVITRIRSFDPPGDVSQVVTQGES